MKRSSKLRVNGMSKKEARKSIGDMKAGWEKREPFKLNDDIIEVFRIIKTARPKAKYLTVDEYYDDRSPAVCTWQVMNMCRNKDGYWSTEGYWPTKGYARTGWTMVKVVQDTLESLDSKTIYDINKTIKMGKLIIISLQEEK